MTSAERLIPVFMPSLGEVLAHAERRQGKPLTAAEVVQIRDGSVCIMLKPEAARHMEASRGYADIDPEDCWADWHRLRPQLLGGYLPKIILCFAADAEFARSAKKVLSEQGVEHEVRGPDTQLEGAFRAAAFRADPSFSEEDWRGVREHTSVVYVISPSVRGGTNPVLARQFLELAARLLDLSGRAALKCESSGIAHGRSRWMELAAHAKSDDVPTSRGALVRGYLQFPIGDENEMYSCGMHLLGRPDLILDPRMLEGDRADRAAANFIDAFARYLVVECVGDRRFRSGNTFSTGPDTQRLRGVWEPCAGYAEDDFFHNPFGRLRFSPA